MGSPADLLTNFTLDYRIQSICALQSIDDRIHIMDGWMYLIQKIPLNTYNHMLNLCPTMKESLI